MVTCSVVFECWPKCNFAQRCMFSTFLHHVSPRCVKELPGTRTSIVGTCYYRCWSSCSKCADKTVRFSPFFIWYSAIRWLYRPRLLYRSASHRKYRSCYPRFVFRSGHVGVGGAAGFAYFLTGIKIWCLSYSSLNAGVLLERSLQTPLDFIHRMQRAPSEKEAAGILFAVQRPGDLLHVPHLKTHSVLTFDLGTTTILAGWDCCKDQ